jgi:WD40 repeat protein
LIWSPDCEHIVAFGMDMREISVWNSASGETSCIYSGHPTPPIQTLAWSLNGKRIASVGCQEKTVHIWNPTDGATICIYREHISQVQRLAWSPDGKQISKESSAEIWFFLSGCFAGANRVTPRYVPP